MTAIVLEITGVLVVLFGIREVFRDIFHPARSGTLSDFVGRFSSLTMRHTRLRTAAGPLALVGTIFCWVTALVCGFALIYAGLAMQQRLTVPPASSGGWGLMLQALYFSLGSFDTFQTFSLDPKPSWLRLVVVVEGLIGVSMITASISWMMVLYPALSRMRKFARRTAVLLQSEKRTGLSLVENLGTSILTELTHGVIQFRLDIVFAPILLNFYTTEEAATISHFLPEILRLAAESNRESSPEPVRLTGSQLQLALELLAQTLTERVVRSDPADLKATFEALQLRDR